MDFKDDSSAAKLPEIRPESSPQPTLLEEQLGDMEDLADLPPLPEHDIYAIPATEEPKSVHEPRRTFIYKVRTASNYGLGFALFFMVNFGLGVLMATMLWNGDMEPVLDFVKQMVRSLR